MAETGFMAGSIVAKLFLDKTGWNSSVKAVTADQKKLEQDSKALGQSMQDMGKKMAVAGAVITGAFTAMIYKTAEYGELLHDTAQKTGVSVEVLSGFKLAADKVGLSIDDMAKGFKFLSMNMVEASSAAGDGAKLFDAMGIKVKDSTGKLRDSGEIMLEVADRFASMEDGAQKTTLAVKLFGKSGIDMIPILNLGSKGLREQRDLAEKLGVTFTTQGAAAADKFRDSLDELKASGQGLGKSIGETLIPMATDISQAITGVIAKISEWTRAHPGLTQAVGTIGISLGGALTVMGTFIYMAGSMVIKLGALSTALGTTKLALLGTAGAVTVLVTAMGFYVLKLFELKSAIDSADEADKRFVEKNIDLSNKLYELVTTGKMAVDTYYKLWDQFNGNALALANYIREGKAGKMAQEGLVEIGKKHGAAIDEQRKTLNLLGPVMGNIGDTQKKLGEMMTEYGIKPMAEKQKRISELMGFERELNNLLKKGEISATDYAAAIKKADDEIIGLRLTVTKTIPPARELNDIWKKAPATFKDAAYAAWTFEGALKDVSNEAMVSENTVLAFLYNVRAEFLRTMGVMVPEWQTFSKAAETAANETKGFMSDVSTTIADSMREIARSIAGLIDFKKLFGATSKSATFNSKPFDDMAKAAKASYDKIKGLADSEYDARERQITRAQEDEDRRYKHKYDLEVKGINDSTMTEDQKQSAIEALDIKYEEAKIARDRQREDEKYAREEAQKAKLLALETAHEMDLQKIRDDADKARQKLADDEEKRQNSLWFKVKGIVATAFEEITTSFLTKMLEPIGSGIAKLAGKLVGKGTDTVTGALDETGKGVGSLGKTIGDFIGGIGKGIGQFISGLATGVAQAVVAIATGIATAIVTLATGIATAATILAAAAVPLLIVAGIALAIFAGFSLISSIFSKGGGKSDDVTFWLKIISDNIQIIQNRISAEYWTAMAELVAGKNRMIEQNDGLKGSLDLTRDVLNGAIDWARRDICGWLRSIDGRFGDLKSAAGGAVSTTTELVAVHGTPANPEYILPAQDLSRIVSDGPERGAAAGPRDITINVNMNGQMITDREYTRARLIPEIIQAARSGLKAELQAALGVA